MKSQYDWKTTNTKSIAILRVSSKRQEGNTSHDVQLDTVRKYADRQGLALPEEQIFKIVESAKDADDREEFQQIFNDALKKGCRHVIYYMTDREGRNFTDIEKAQKLIKANKIVVHYAHESKMLHAKSPASDFFLRACQALQDKQLSVMISEKVNDAARLKCEEGEFPGNRPPLGYVQVKKLDQSGKELKRGCRVIPDPNEHNVKLVKREFWLRAQGLSYDQIREKVISEGLVSADKVASYHRSAIEKRLKNPFYRGFFDWQGIRYKGTHELIISEKTLAAIDRIQGKSPQRFSPESNGIFAGGWLKCSQCGCNIVYDPKKPHVDSEGVKHFKHHYYHCTNGKKLHPSMKGMSIEEREIWAQFEKVVASIHITEELAKAIADALNETKVKMKAKFERDIEAFKIAEGELRKKADKLFDLFAAERIGEDEYRHQNERLRKDQDALTEKLRIAQASITDAGMETTQSILELAMHAKTLWNQRDLQEKRDLLNKLLSNPRLDGVTVRFDLKKPFVILEEMTKKENWRPHGDSNPGYYRERVVS